MLIIRTAFKNIIAGGKKTWLNVFVLSFTMVIMVALIALVEGWVEDTRNETIRWETGVGQWQHPEYDKYDIFTLQDAHGPTPAELAPYIDNGTAEPLLIMQGTIYPQGRMQSILLKGIDASQTILEIPSHILKHDNGDYIPAIVGVRMARSAQLSEGDVVMLRWRDKNGVFDAQEIIIAGIFGNKVPGIDVGQVWLNIDDLYRMAEMHGEATLVVKSDGCPLAGDAEGWVYRGLDYLMADLDAMLSAQWVEVGIIFALLMALCLLAIYDTQTLSIFRRQKEIGTSISLGLAPKAVVGMFTIEGTMYSLLAVIAGLVWGGPLLWLFGKHGMTVPGSFEEMLGTDVYYPIYHFSSIALCLVLIIVLSALISYLPSRKIASQNVVDALKNKIR